MAKIVKLTQNGATVHPATTTSAVVDPDLRVPVDKLVEEINVSKLYPTGGVGGTNKYTLEGAIAKMPTKYRTVGIKCSFVAEDGSVQMFVFQGGTFTSTDSWAQGTGGAGGGNMILEWATDAATTRKQVKAKERKAGMQISYLSPTDGWINEQYVGNALSDVEWTKDGNWSVIADISDIEAVDITTTITKEHYSQDCVVLRNMQFKFKDPNYIVKSNSHDLVAFQVSQERSVIVLNKYNEKGDFEPRVYNELPQNEGEYTPVESLPASATNQDVTKLTTTKGNWLLIMKNKSDATYLHGDKLISISKDGAVFDGKERILNGKYITKDVVSEGDFFPRFKNIIQAKNLINPDDVNYSQYLNLYGLLNSGSPTYGVAHIKDVNTNEWHCFSSIQDLGNKGWSGISIMCGNSSLAFALGETYSNKGGMYNIEIELLPEYNGFKFRTNINFPCEVCIYVGQKAKTSKIQLEKGEVPTDYTAYAPSLGMDFSSEISKLNQNVNSLKSQIENVKSVPSRWNGCKYCSIGDSITDENLDPKRKYCTIIKEGLSCSVYNGHGRNGQSMARVATIPGSSFMEDMGNVDFTLYDLYTIALSTNDFARNVPIGDADSVDDSTFWGAYKKTLDSIFKANPLARIVLLTPLQRGDQNTANKAGHKLIDYVNAIKDIAVRYSCPVIDFYCSSGISKSNMSTYMYDGLHPNALGQEYIGAYALSLIKNM